MGKLEITNLTKTFGDGKNQIIAVDDLNIEIKDGEFLVLVGPSGCGKSTTLRAVAGLEMVTKGEILIDDRPVADEKPSDRDIAMVFQNYALYPHMTARENMAFGLRMATDLSEEEITRRVEDAAAMMGIEPLLNDRPGELSGGQQQRVALGRAIVREPSVFLLDEPLSNLDAKLRTQMRTELQELQQRLDVTTIYVTHDQTEAMTMGDRIAVLNDGKLQQIGTPLECYHTPANKFVAGFIGSPSMNFIDVTIEGQNGKLYGVTPGFKMEVPQNAAQGLENYIGKTVTMGVRPEHLIERSRLNGQAPEGSLIPVTVDVVELLGNEIFVYLTNRGAVLTARMPPDMNLTRGQNIEVAAESDKLHFFDTQTDAAIRR